MSFSRHIASGFAMAALAGCATPSIRTVGDTAALKIAAVSVDTSKMTFAVEGRKSDVSKEQLQADLEAAVSQSLAAKSDPAGIPVKVEIVMSQLRLAPPLERVVAGTSSATGQVTVTEIGQPRRVIVPPTEVVGNTNNFRAVALIGLATTASVEKDYQGTLAGFADTIRKALFGSEQ